MNIYIPDIELPKDEPRTYTAIVMYVGADGKLRAECEGTHEVTIVPPHGRLIDADELMRRIQLYIDEYELYVDENGFHCEKWCAMKETEMAINDAPTVIEAESSSERELQRDYEVSVEYAQHCGRYEPTYDQDTGAM